MKDKIIEFIAEHTIIIPISMMVLIFIFASIGTGMILDADIPDWLKYILLK